MPVLVCYDSIQLTVTEGGCVTGEMRAKIGGDAHVFRRMPGEVPVRKAAQVIPVVICQLGTFELANSCDTGDVSLGAINVTLLKKHQIPW